MTEQDVSGDIDVVVGAESEVRVFLLGGRIDIPALVAAERSLLVVVGDDVLPEFGPDSLEQIADVADDRVVPKNRVFGLRYVVEEQRKKRENHDP